MSRPTEEHERGGACDARERADIAPGQRLLEDEDREHGKDRQSDDFLDNLELAAAEAGAFAEPAGPMSHLIVTPAKAGVQPPLRREAGLTCRSLRPRFRRNDENVLR